MALISLLILCQCTSICDSHSFTMKTRHRLFYHQYSACLPPNKVHPYEHNCFLVLISRWDLRSVLNLPFCSYIYFFLLSFSPVLFSSNTCQSVCFAEILKYFELQNQWLALLLGTLKKPITNQSDERIDSTLGTSLGS